MWILRMKRDTINNCDRITGGLRTVSSKSGRRYDYLTYQGFWHLEILSSFVFQDTTFLDPLLLYLLCWSLPIVQTSSCSSAQVGSWNSLNPCLLGDLIHSHGQDTGDYQRCTFPLHSRFMNPIISSSSPLWCLTGIPILISPTLDLWLFSPSLLVSVLHISVNGKSVLTVAQTPVFNSGWLSPDSAPLHPENPLVSTFKAHPQSNHLAPSLLSCWSNSLSFFV